MSAELCVLDQSRRCEGRAELRVRHSLYARLSSGFSLHIMQQGGAVGKIDV